jgi:hypothetical protein
VLWADGPAACETHPMNAASEHAPRFVEQLALQELSIEDILLDPNNPRLLTGDRAPVPDRRIPEDEVQRRAAAALEDGPFDMSRMRSSVQRSGLLPVDRVVVRPLDEAEGKYVVVEGNRRIGAAKKVLELDHAAEITLADDVRESLRRPTVLVLENHDEQAARTDQWVIQGIRHISGIKPWGAYQVAKTIEAMTTDLGYTPEAAADALSIEIGRVRRALRVLSALRQMQEDEDFGDQAKPGAFGYFDEALRSVKVRTWLGWNQANGTFDNDENRAQFYAWITDDEQFEENPEHRRIPSPDGVRKLNQILDSQDAVDLMNVPGARVDQVHSTLGLETEPEWRAPVKRALTALEAIPIGTLEELSEEDRVLIEELRDLSRRRLEQAAALAQPGEAAPAAG